MHSDQTIWVLVVVVLLCGSAAGCSRSALGASHLSDSAVVNSVDVIGAAIPVVDPVHLFDGLMIGCRVELMLRVQTAEMIDGRLHLMLIIYGIQLDAVVRRVEGIGWESLIGTDVRFCGVVVLAAESSGSDSRDRIVIASFVDIGALGARAVAVAGLCRLLIIAAGIKAFSSNEVVFGHCVRLRAQIIVFDPVWTVLFVHDIIVGIFVFMRSLKYSML